SYLDYRSKKREWKSKMKTWYDTEDSRKSFIVLWGDKFDQTKHAKKFQNKLSGANIKLTPSEFYGILILAVMVITLLISNFFSIGFPLNLIVSVGVVEIIRRSLFFLRRNKYQEQMAQQLPEICRLLANATRSGMTLDQSFGLAAHELDAPANKEFERLSQELYLGVGFENVLEGFQNRMSNKDFKLFAATLSIQKKSGGDLHSVLDEMAETFENRKVLSQEVKTMTAEQRFISYVVPAMPIFLVLVMNSIIDGFLDPLFSGIGLILLALFLTGTVLTFFLVKKVTDIRV